MTDTQPANRPIRVRMAPSPTGPLHIGTARTSLYNYLFARHAGGTYVLRIEDTDTARSTVEYERDIIDNLHWLGITWDEGPQVAGGEDVGPYGPYRQSQRLELYAREAQRLLDSGHAYHCWCSPEELEAVRREQEANREAPRYNGRCLRLTDAERAQFEREGRRPAIRLRVPPELIRFDDLIRGEVEFDNSLLGDFVIVRANGVPLYHFVVVVDDEAMQITHVIRGEDHLSNTPKHIALMRALGYAEPRFGHIPLILNPDRSKMSKRRSQTAITAYREQGYLPEAMVNFLAFLGWSPGTEEEIFSLDQLAERFEIGDVHKGGAVFDADRLNYLNGVYIRNLTDQQLALRLRPFLPAVLDDASVLRVVPLIKERLVRLADAPELVAFLWETDAQVAALYDAELLLPRNRSAAEVAEAVARARDELGALDEADFAADVLEDRCRRAADDMGWKAGDFFRPLRVAVTGRTISPPLFGSMELLGRERVLARLETAIGVLAAAGARTA
ncbi:MAG TPA: glutamate--tRNA ligase [candidate division Zixibacteria bacterium]|nr:glutamate--tRNA ligase [candidate division Zixibacteria bacterium]